MIWVFLSVALNAVAQIFLKRYALFAEGFGGSKIGLILNSNLILAGFCYAASIVTWISALKTVRLSAAYPVQSLGYVIVAILSFYIFREKINVQYMTGLLIIVLGVVVLSWKIE